VVLRCQASAHGFLLQFFHAKFLRCCYRSVFCLSAEALVFRSCRRCFRSEARVLRISLAVSQSAQRTVTLRPGASISAISVFCIKPRPSVPPSVFNLPPKWPKLVLIWHQARLVNFRSSRLVCRAAGPAPWLSVSAARSAVISSPLLFSSRMKRADQRLQLLCTSTCC
jgi:hypothetical protein